MPMSKLNDIPQEYLQYMVDIMHKEGHHYFFHALVNEEGFYKHEKRNVIGHKCYFYIEADGLLLLGLSIASETVPRAANLWGRRCCLWNLKMPVGTVGVYTCALVDNTKENWIELTHANGSKTSHHFSHAKLPNGTLLHYTIRISFTEYIVSTDFDKTIVPQESETPNYINAFFSEALNIINFDADVPST
ncbi:uncharacterized protein [Dermacentor albipictus]|uniref:uncharacterized protein isoform X3 n=1 Tax=Dermacentor albipictus TaxID=60249 RepID=UPI0038FCA4FB